MDFYKLCITFTAWSCSVREREQEEMSELCALENDPIEWMRPGHLPLKADLIANETSRNTVKSWVTTPYSTTSEHHSQKKEEKHGRKVISTQFMETVHNQVIDGVKEPWCWTWKMLNYATAEHAIANCCSVSFRSEFNSIVCLFVFVIFF